MTCKRKSKTLINQIQLARNMAASIGQTYSSLNNYL